MICRERSFQSKLICHGLLVVALTLGCSGGGGDAGPTAPPPPPPAAVASVTVALAPTAIAVGATATATATLRDAAGNTLSGRTVVWSSSNTAVASVSSTGTVTGVTPGSANIVATSEGQSGQAALTVNAPPNELTVQISEITVNGQPADLTRIAGTIRVASNVTLPTGFTGSLVATIRGVEMARVPIAQAAPAQDAARASAFAPAPVLNISTTDLNATLDALGDLQIRPKQFNGIAQLVLTAQSASGGQQASVTQNITLANPSGSLVGVAELIGASATGTDGNTWHAGDIQVLIGVASYEPPAPNGQGPFSLDNIEFRLGSGTALYGRSDASVSIITKSGGTKHTILKSELSGHSGPLATSIWGESYRLRNGSGAITSFDPQVTRVATNGVTLDGDGDSFADITPPSATATLPAGIMRVATVNDITTQLPSGRKWINLSLAFRYDHAAPVWSPSGFSATGRSTTLHQSMLDANGSACCLNNWFSIRHDWRFNLDYTKLTDAGVGYTPNDIKFYFGADPDPVRLKQFGVAWPLGGPVTPTLSRTHYVSAELADLLGNSAGTLLRTTSGNPYTTGDVIGTSGAPALVGFADGPKTAQYSGLIDGARINVPNPGTGLYWQLTGISVGPDGVPVQFLGAKVRKDGSCFISGDPQCTQPANVPSSFSAPATGKYAFSDLLAHLNAPDKQGVYETELFAYDNKGTAMNGPHNSWSLRTIFDYTPPTNVSGTAPTAAFTGGQKINLTGMAKDNLHVAQMTINAHYQTFNSSFFALGHVNGAQSSTPMTDPSSDPLEPNFTTTFNIGLAHHIRLHGSAGEITSPWYPLTGQSYTAIDAGVNATYGPITPIPGGFLPQPSAPADLNLTLTHSPQNVCAPRATSCGSTPTTSQATVTVTTAQSLPPIAEVLIFAMVASRAVQVCRTNLFTTQALGTLFAYTFLCTVNWALYWGHPGAAFIFAWAIATSGEAEKSAFHQAYVDVRY